MTKKFFLQKMQITLDKTPKISYKYYSARTLERLRAIKQKKAELK